MIYKILEEAIKLKSSDIHINEDEYIRYRINGELEESIKKIYIDKTRMKIIKEDLIRNKLSIYEEENDLDFSLEYKNYRLRGYIFKQRNKDSIIIRIITKKIPEIDELNLPEVIKDFKNYKEGLVLITGPTGSGKSTTLASIINEINKTFKRHIITLEQPIEYIYANNKSIINQREIGKDLDSYSEGVVRILRGDPDIIVLGEIRDLETVSNVITLAETGHLVFATLHTKSVSETIDRVLDIFPSGRQKQVRIQFANCIKAIVCQRLYSGRKGGRVPCCEILIANKAIRNLIREGKSPNTIIDQIYMNTKELGCQTMEQGMKTLIEKGLLENNLVKNIDDI